MMLSITIWIYDQQCTESIQAGLTLIYTSVIYPLYIQKICTRLLHLTSCCIDNGWIFRKVQIWAKSLFSSTYKIQFLRLTYMSVKVLGFFFQLKYRGNSYIWTIIEHFRFTVYCVTKMHLCETVSLKRWMNGLAHDSVINLSVILISIIQ